MHPAEHTQKTIYLVRHGQSEGNITPVFQSTDSPLSTEGKRQSHALATRLDSLPIETIISSPLPRAKNTAEIITATTHHAVEYEDLFVERIRPTATEGKPWHDQAAAHLWKQWEESLVTPGIRVEDGENYEDITTRADKVLTYLHARKEQTILVITHAYLIRTIAAKILLGNTINGDALRRCYERTDIENTSITTLTYRDAFEEPFCWRISSLNDHAHITNKKPLQAIVEQ